MAKKKKKKGQMAIYMKLCEVRVKPHATKCDANESPTIRLIINQIWSKEEKKHRTHKVE